LAVQGFSLRFLALPRQCPPLKTRRGKTQKPLTDQGLGYFRGSKRKPSAGVGRFSAKGTKIYAFFWKVWKGANEKNPSLNQKPHLQMTRQRSYFLTPQMKRNSTAPLELRTAQVR
jgi:hypothetical protein